MKKTKFIKGLVALAVTGAVMLASTLNAFACTSFYMGKDVTENGTSIWGRSEDISARFSKIHTVHQAETHEEGDMYHSSTGFSCPYPAQTLRYTVVKDSIHNEGGYPEPYGEAGINEKNVAISATVTLSRAHTAITNIDPMVSTSRGGLSEEDIATVVLMQATSARHAMEILAGYIDTYGAAGREGVMVSDPNEIWFMQILSGHQYIAEKAPDDKVGFSPNITMTGAININDRNTIIASSDLVSTAEAAGTLTIDEATGYINVVKSYAQASASVSNRLWQGYYYLKDEEAANALTSGYYEYFTEARPEKNYTLFEAMRLLAYRGEGTDKYAGSATGNSAGIGNDATVEAHVFETRYDMPEALATVEWLAMGPAEFSVYIPSYGSLITETYEKYWIADSATFNEDSMYWVFRQLYTLCKTNRENYGANVLAFWETYQKELIEQQAVIDEKMSKLYEYSPELAQEKATALSKWAAKEAYTNAKLMMEELQAFINSGSQGVFIPSVLTKNVLPNYTFEAIDGELSYLLLDRTIEYAQEAKAAGALDGVVESVATAFEAALENAVKTRGEAVIQQQIDGAAEELINVIHYLEYKQADTSQLIKLVEAAEKYEGKEGYTPATYKVFEEALQAARAVLADGDVMDITDVNKAWDSLAKAILDLRFIPDKSLLAGLLTSAKATDLTLYTAESGAVLLNSIEAAQLVLDDETAGEDDVKQAESGLIKAMDALQILDTAAGAENTTDENSTGDTSGTDSSGNTYPAGIADAGNAGNPKTGDSSPLFITATFVFASGMAMLIFKRKKD